MCLVLLCTEIGNGMVSPMCTEHGNGNILHLCALNMGMDHAKAAEFILITAGV